jgi:DNA-directed RNA polymerase specialized sigma24 family protein
MEAKFIEQLRSGDPCAVEELRNTMRVRLKRLYLDFGFDEVEARSLADLAITVALLKIETFESRARLSTWVFGIAQNVGRNILRSKFDGGLPRDILDAPQLVSLDDPAVDLNILPTSNNSVAKVPTLTRSKRHVRARRAWLSLKKSDRRVLLETQYVGLPPAEIARRENISVGAIWSRRCRARKRLDAVYQGLAVDDQTDR